MAIELTPYDVVGLLADGDRLRVAAALVLGSTTLADVVEATGLDERRAGTAITRLVRGGLVETDEHGFRVREEVLRATARAAAPKVEPDEYPGVSPEEVKVLRAFVRGGRLLSIPAHLGKRRVVLDLIVQGFEPGKRYRERQVNLMLGKWHADVAALRRYLVDEGFLSREAGVYWRIGGTFDPVAE